MMGRQKSVLEAQQLMARQKAMADFAAGDRSPATMAAINPDKAVEQFYKPDEHLASQGMMRTPDGSVVPIPGYNQALAAQAEAKTTGQMVPVVPGGMAFAKPAPSSAALPAAAPAQADLLKQNPQAIIAAGAARQAGVDPDLFLSMIQAESGFNPQATSPKGAQGLGQLMPATAKARGVTDPYNAQQNATAAAQEFRSLQDKYQNPQLAVMAYNWGQGNVDNWLKSGGDPKAVPNETITHLRKVFGAGQQVQPQAMPQAQAQAPVADAGQTGQMYDARGRFIGFKSPDTAGESVFDKTTGESLGKLFVSKQETAVANRQSASKMQAIADTLKGIETGKFSEAMLEGKRTLKAAGLDMGAMGITDNVGQLDAARALANQMALELRNPAGGAGMPGAMSDQDRTFLQSMSGGLGMTTQGRALLLESQKRIAARSSEEAKVVRDYAKSHGGRLDIGVYDALESLAQKPMFDAEFMVKAQSLSGGTSPTQPQGVQPGRMLRWNPKTGRVE
jgi:soluble lytic murein transglycosylase-like protein